jgi:hypothetical protein
MARQYGSLVPASYADWVVDSVDADPVYWSRPGSRWNYHPTATGFSAADSPGPALKTELGAVYALKFRMGLYRLADVPLVTTGNVGAAAPVDETFWDYSVRVDPVSGDFTHPAI